MQTGDVIHRVTARISQRQRYLDLTARGQSQWLTAVQILRRKEGTAGSHGAPLGDDEIALTRERLGWSSSESFHVPGDVASHMAEIASRGKADREAWDFCFYYSNSRRL